MKEIKGLIYENGIVVDCLKEFQKKVDWNYISKYQKLSEGFIEKFQDKVHRGFISQSQKLSEEFIEKFQDKVQWGDISMYQKLSEKFIEKFKKKVDWYYISTYQKLSEEFIEKFQDKVQWGYISPYQKLSEGFIEKFQDKVQWGCISQYQKLSEGFIEKFQDRIISPFIADSWRNKTTEEKKEAVIATKLYKCYKDHFIAYKGIRSDRYSKYNFQYQYLKGKTYESFADFSDEENSFGLSVWTGGEATKYCDELVVKVKVRYEDVARIVHKNGKIRCTKITILT